MRAVFTAVAVAALLFATACVTKETSRGGSAPPSAAEIKDLVHKSLAERTPPVANLAAYRGVELTGFEMLSLDRQSTDSWQARLEMSFDFGEQPAAVHGYQRYRKGLYRVVLKPRDGQWALDRFTPLGKVTPLPKAG